MGKKRYGREELRGRLREGLCSRHCFYYKPFRDEELSCLGFSVLELFLARGGDVPLGQTSSTDDCPGEGKALVGTLCRRCPYYEEDCDFVAGTKDAKPCGGFGVMLFLVRDQVISIGEIADCLNFPEES